MSASGRRGLLVAGVATLAAGLLVLGYVAWQFLGTNWVSQRRQAEVVADVERGWEAGKATTRVDAGVADAVVRIPRFGDDYAVPVLEGTGDDVLASGFGHFEDTAAAGEVGNYALAAHRITHGEPLRDMPELRVGDTVVVDTAEVTYTYRLTTGGDDLTVSFTDTWVIDEAPTNPDPDGVQPPQQTGARLLTLTTCSELFHTDDRLVAFGVLVDRQRRSAAG